MKLPRAVEEALSLQNYNIENLSHPFCQIYGGYLFDTEEFLKQHLKVLCRAQDIGHWN